jgi:hypothetical protein
MTINAKGNESYLIDLVFLPLLVKGGGTDSSGSSAPKKTDFTLFRKSTNTVSCSF